MPSEISQLLRQSRVAQVVRTTAPCTPAKPRFVPTHQVIETKPSSLYRQEWGLKAPIPSKIKSRYLVFNDLDTLERITTFETNAGIQWTRLRFQELGTVPSYNVGMANPLFPSSQKKDSGPSTMDSTHSLASFFNMDNNTMNQDKQLKRLLIQLQPYRKEFQQWLLKKNPLALYNKAFNAKMMKSDLLAFLQTKFQHRRANTHKHSVVAAGGLTYNLQGKLHNTANGVVQKKIVPGRILNSEHEKSNSNRIAAIAGFVADINSSTSHFGSRELYNSGDFIRQNVLPFEIKETSVQNNGRLTIKARVTGKRKNSEFGISSKSYYQRPLRRSTGSQGKAINAENSSNQAKLLIDILKRNNKS